MCMCVYLCGDMYLSAGTCRVQRCPIPRSGSHRWLWALRRGCWELNWSSSSATVICTLNCWANSPTLLLFLKVTFIFIDDRYFFFLHFNSITRCLYYVAQIGLKFIISLSLCPTPQVLRWQVCTTTPACRIYFYYSPVVLFPMKFSSIKITKHNHLKTLKYKRLFENIHNTVHPLYKNLNY